MPQPNVPFFTTRHQDERYGDEIRRRVDGVLRSGQFILGDEVSSFEARLSQFMQSTYAVGVANGSDALFLAVQALGMPEGAEVLTTPFTFFASTACIVRNQLRPVFVDVDYDSHHVTAESYARAMSKKTAAILSVDLFSHTSDNAALSDLARSSGLHFIEDAAEAFGMGWSGHKAGSQAAVSVLSFFPTKTLGCAGDGGAVLTQNPELAAAIKRNRVHGASKKYHHVSVGINSRLDALQAAILNVKMNHVVSEIEERAKIARWYFEALADCPGLRLPWVPKNADPVWYVFSIKADRRDELESHLGAAHIGTSVYYPVPMHLQECFKSLGYRAGDFPVAERLCRESLALPMFIGMTESDVSYVADAIKKFYR